MQTENELARMVEQARSELSDLSRFGVTFRPLFGGAPIPPTGFYAIREKPDQSRNEWELKGRRPGR